MEPSHCIGTFWTEREIAVIDVLSKKQELSHVAVLRQALRNYQLSVEGIPDIGDKSSPGSYYCCRADFGQHEATCKNATKQDGQ